MQKTGGDRIENSFRKYPTRRLFKIAVIGGMFSFVEHPLAAYENATCSFSVLRNIFSRCFFIPVVLI